MKEIDDNEIRIIGSHRHRWPWYGWVAVGMAVAALIAVAVWLLQTSGNGEKVVEPQEAVALPQDKYLQVMDTVVDGVPLTLYVPMNMNASLMVGMPDATDTTLVLAVMAADVRADNGGIVGDFVLDGRVLARGERKEGFCAMVGCEFMLGTSGGDKYLEMAKEQGGSFFRQYVLVARGEAIPPKPKGRNHRRALCLRGGEVVVAESVDRETYADFADALAALGADDAISLVGSEALLMYYPEGALLHTVGDLVDSPNVNFIVWRR